MLMLHLMTLQLERLVLSEVSCWHYVTIDFWRRKTISALHFSSKLIENEMYFTWKSVRWCINEGRDEKNECILSMCSKTLVAFLVNSITFTKPVHLSDKIGVIAPKISWYLKGKTNLFPETVKVPKSEFLYQADDVKDTE